MALEVMIASAAAGLLIQVGAAVEPQETAPVAAPPAALRIPGTPGYASAVDWIKRSLEANDVPFETEEIEFERAATTRSDCLLFEDSATEYAFAGLRERMEASSSELPAAYDWNPELADVRGPIVDVGACTREDLDALVAAKIALQGAVGLAAPSGLTVDQLSSLANDYGLAALLVASPETVDPTDVVLLPHRARAPLALPCVPVRGVEVEMIRSRLRAKRIRGANGSATTIKAGPGPVEARVSVECPRTPLSDIEIIRVTGSAETSLFVDASEDPSRPAGGAPFLWAAVRGVTQCNPTRQSIVFGPPAAREDNSWTFDAPLAPRGLPSDDSTFGMSILIESGDLPRRLPGLLNETVADLNTRLGGELETRIERASTWICSVIVNPDHGNATEAVRTALGDAMLLSPIPSARNR